MNNQTRVTSLFGCACQDVAMCGHKTSLITVCERSVHSVAPIPGGHTGFMLLIPHSSRSDMTLWLLLNKACLCQSDRTRAVLGGHGWNADEDRGQGAGSVKN